MRNDLQRHLGHRAHQGMGAIGQDLARQMLPQLIDTIEIRTRYSPPIIMKVNDLVAPGPPGPTTTFFKPVLILRGGIGEKVIAPAGTVEEDEWIIPAIVAGTAVAFGLAAVVRAAFEMGKHQKKKQLAASST